MKIEIKSFTQTQFECLNWYKELVGEVFEIVDFDGRFFLVYYNRDVKLILFNDCRLKLRSK